MHKADFPSLQSDLIYLDSAATTQKPAAVIEAVTNLYTTGIANPGRGLYDLSLKATDLVTEARQAAAKLIGGQSNQIVFTSGATEGLNLIAQSIKPGDEVIVSTLEHHSNILPWQTAGAILKYLPVNLETGQINLETLGELLSEKTQFVSLSLVSNVFGTKSPLEQVKKILEQQGSRAKFVIDACQAVPHIPLSVSELGADFLVFSAHKMYGPSGVGILWGEDLTTLLPIRPGGGSVETVTAETAIWKDGPERLEGGTPNLEGIVGFLAATQYLDYPQISTHTLDLTRYTTEKLSTITGITILSANQDKFLVSFTSADMHPHDIAQILADQGICIRAGHHCAGPLHQALNLPATARISFGIYNNREDIDKLVAVLIPAIEKFHNA